MKVKEGPSHCWVFTNVHSPYIGNFGKLCAGDVPNAYGAVELLNNFSTEAERNLWNCYRACYCDRKGEVKCKVLGSGGRADDIVYVK